jgi:hypothetical protein
VGLYQTKFLHHKLTVTRLRRLPRECEKIFARYSPNKGPESIQNLKNLNLQRINNPIKEKAHELNREFSKEEVQIHEEVLNFPGHKRNANRNYTKISFHNKCWQGCGETGAPIHYWWECKLYNHYGKQYGDSLKS